MCRNSEIQKPLDSQDGIKQSWGRALVVRYPTSTLKAWVGSLAPRREKGSALDSAYSLLRAAGPYYCLNLFLPGTHGSFPFHSEGLAVVTLVGIIVGVLLAIGFVGGIIVVVMRKISGRFS